MYIVPPMDLFWALTGNPGRHLRCAHTQRDGRCGFCGPKLTAKALELKREVLPVGDDKNKLQDDHGGYEMIQIDI